jgi:hypothetical protein
MREHFERAIGNITEHGDTDIFPFPIENLIFFDKKEAVVGLLIDLDNDFSSCLASSPPSNYSALTPVGYTGFRWATQIDPLWNAYLLGLVLSIATDIENSRIPKHENVVFSYRYNPHDADGTLFDKEFNWRSFMERSIVLAKQNSFVVSCDISEFYSRLNHHRLENALKQLDLKGDQIFKIKALLSNFSGTYSFGIPIGGPAARILSELLLGQIDKLLRLEGIQFCRFADDYHIFSDSYEDAFRSLVFLSERLLLNQGLQLQKAKTKIMSGAEFIATSPIGNDDDAPADESSSDIKEQSQNLMRFAIRFDPYSPTAAGDYELLRAELEKFDILSLLKTELVKSRIHISLSKKIVSAVRYIRNSQRDEAILSLVSNETLLYPIYSNVLWVVKILYDELADEMKEKVIQHVRKLVKERSHAMQIDLTLSYAIRLLSCSAGPENEETLNRVFKETSSITVRRDIILAMAKWKAWYWLSDLRSSFRTLSPAERRAFLVASYVLTDEGRHWRDHIKQELSPFELLVRTWASEKVQISGWSVPV